MIHTYSPAVFFVRFLRTYWIGLVVLLLAGLVLLANQGAQAAPPNQTVPPKPTATPTNAPRATNTPQSDDDDDNQQQPAPTATTTPSSATQPTGEALTGVVTTSRLNVRQGPGTDFTAIGVVLQGETLRILERNDPGTWWRICCATGGDVEGWVSAQFVRPNFDAAQANTLIPVAGAAPPAAPTTVPTVAVTTTTTSEVVSVVTPTQSLELTMVQVPVFVWQGQEFELQFVVTNPGDTAISNVELRNQLPPELTFVGAEVGGDGKLTEQSGDDGQFVFRVLWPALGAGESLTVAVTLQMAEDIPDGTVIDNLAVVSADNAAPYTAGISIGLPPTAPPDFQ